MSDVLEVRPSLWTGLVSAYPDDASRINGAGVARVAIVAGLFSPEEGVMSTATRDLLVDELTTRLVEGGFRLSLEPFGMEQTIVQTAANGLFVLQSLTAPGVPATPERARYLAEQMVTGYMRTLFEAWATPMAATVGRLTKH